MSVKNGRARVVRAIRSVTGKSPGLNPNRSRYKGCRWMGDEVGSGRDAVLLQLGHEAIAVDPLVEADDVDEPAHPRGLGRHVRDLHSVEVTEAFVVPGGDPGTTSEEHVEASELRDPESPRSSRRAGS